MSIETSRTRPYGHLNDLTIDQLRSRIRSVQTVIRGLRTGFLIPASSITREQDIAQEMECLAEYMDLLHGKAIKMFSNYNNGMAADELDSEDTVCEGHYNEDSVLLSGNPGGPMFCDGACCS